MGQFLRTDSLEYSPVFINQSLGRSGRTKETLEILRRQCTRHTRLLIFIWALAFYGNNHNENLFYNKYISGYPNP